MRTIELGKSGMQVPTIAVGCWRIHNLEVKEAERIVKGALDLGANFFDHADIYGGGKCESIFAQAAGMSPSVREKMILQSKCGIMRGQFNFSKEHILEAVEGSLSRLKTDYLDVLLLHRPDILVEPEEVAQAFDALHAAGKVRFFGVSNQHPRQMELLMKYVKQPLVANQLQLSITNATMLSSGVNVNMVNDSAVNRDGYVLDFCRLMGITIQPWSPFQFGEVEGVFLDNPKFPELNAAIDRVAADHGVSNTTIALAWLLRHPAKMQPITGTMNPARIVECMKAADVTLSREEWYAIYLAAGNKLP